MTRDQDLFRRAMASFATGVTLITVDYAGSVKGMTANAFASVSLEPLLVLVCVDHKAETHSYLHTRKRFGINILSAEQRAVSVHYANPDRESITMEPGAAAKFDRTKHGTPMLHGALAYLECRLQDTRDAGDHTIFIAEVEDLVVHPGEPLLYFRRNYHGLGPEIT